MTAISTSGHPALRRTRTGFPLDAKRCKWHVVGVRCAAPIGTNENWRAIWLRWLDLGRGRSSGRHFGEVTARPATQDRRRVRRLATFGTHARTLARSRARTLARSHTQVPEREKTHKYACAASTPTPRRRPTTTTRSRPLRRSTSKHSPWRLGTVPHAMSLCVVTWENGTRRGPFNKAALFLRILQQYFFYLMVDIAQTIMNRGF